MEIEDYGNELLKIHEIFVNAEKIALQKFHDGDVNAALDIYKITLEHFMQLAQVYNEHYSTMIEKLTLLKERNNETM